MVNVTEADATWPFASNCAGNARVLQGYKLSCVPIHKASSSEATIRAMAVIMSVLQPMRSSTLAAGCPRRVQVVIRAEAQQSCGAIQKAREAVRCMRINPPLAADMALNTSRDGIRTRCRFISAPGLPPLDAPGRRSPCSPINPRRSCCSQVSGGSRLGAAGCADGPGQRDRGAAGAC